MSQGFVPREEQSDFNFLEYLDLLLKHRKLIMTAGLVGGILSLIIYAYTTPMFKSTAKIKLDPMQTSALQYGDSARSFAGAFYFREEYKNTEKQIMVSRAVTEMVIEDLGLDFFKQHFSFKESSGLFSFLKGRKRQSVLTPEQEDARIRNQTVAILRRHIRIDEIKETNLFRVSYISDSPEVAQKVTNTWAHTYIQFGKAEELRRNQDSLDFVTKNLQKLEQNNEVLVSKKAALEAQLDIDLGSNTSVGDETVTSLNQTVLEYQTGVIEAENKLANLEKATPAESLEVGRDPEVQSINAKLQEQKAAFERSEQTLGPKLLDGKRKEIAQIEASLAATQAKVHRKLIEAQRNEVAIKQQNFTQHKQRLVKAE